ncbi:MAG: reverse transcriptase domain-containing protein [Bacteroidota bacterium]
MCSGQKRKASEKNINYGVPQGSILGPLLFLIFINDLSDCATTSKVVLFADDTALLNNDLQLCTNDTQNVKRWLYGNKLTLNVKKTKVISFANGEFPLNFRIDDEAVEQVPTWKYLGLHLDKKLNFSNHIKEIVSSLSKQCGLLYRMRNLFHVKQLVNYHNTYIKSVIQYGVLIYGCTRKALLKLIWLMQKRIARVIFFKKSRESVTQLMLENKMYSVYELHIYELFKEVIKQRMDRSNVNLLPNRSFPRSTRLSEANFIRPEMYKSNRCDLFLQNRLIKTYNYFNNREVLDSVPIMIGSTYSNYIHTVLDNFIVDNRDLDKIIFSK